MKNLAIIVLITIPFLGACKGKENTFSLATKGSSGTTLAKVGNEKIGSDQFVVLYDKVQAGRPFGAVSKEDFLRELVRLELGALEARKEKLDQEPEVEFQLKATLTQALLQKHLSEKVKNINVTDTEMKDYYDKNPQIRASHILLRVPPNADQKSQDEIEKKIGTIYKQAIADKKSFPELAKKYSEDPTGKRGGDLDYFSKDRMVPAFSEAAFSLKEIGDVSQPVKTQFGWHIIQLTGKRGFKDADKNIIRQTLLAEKRKKVVEDYFSSLEQKFKTTIFKDKLESLNTTPPPQPK